MRLLAVDTLGSGFRVTENWFRANTDKICPRCQNLRPNYKGPVDIWIPWGKPENIALNFVWAPALGVARRDFLGLFGEEVQKNLWVGKLFLERKDSSLLELDRFVVFRGKHIVRVRGTKLTEPGPCVPGMEPSESEMLRPGRVCPECSTRSYWSENMHFVVKGALTGARLYVSGRSTLVVDESLVSMTELKKWHKLHIMKLTVLDTPIDGNEEIF